MPAPTMTTEVSASCCPLLRDNASEYDFSNDMGIKKLKKDYNKLGRKTKSPVQPVPFLSLIFHSSL